MNGSSTDHPILGLKLSPTNRNEKERLRSALAEILRDDLSLSMIAEPESHKFALQGRSESYLDSICDRLRDEYRISIEVDSPMVILLETVSRVGEAEGKYFRQVGGKGNYGHCRLRVEPNKADRGYEFVCAVSSFALPNEYVRSIERGVLLAMEAGVLKGHPLVDVKVTLIDGSYHQNDSNPSAFEIAASVALKGAAKNASPVLLEPMMALEIDLPEELASALYCSVYEHRGRVETGEESSTLGGARVILPLSELLSSNLFERIGSPAEFVGFEPISDNGTDEEDGPGVIVNKPDHPRRDRGSAEEE